MADDSSQDCGRDGRGGCDGAFCCNSAKKAWGQFSDRLAEVGQANFDAARRDRARADFLLWIILTLLAAGLAGTAVIGAYGCNVAIFCAIVLAPARIYLGIRAAVATRASREAIRQLTTDVYDLSGCN
jgi:hypothetical protein